MTTYIINYARRGTWRLGGYQVDAESETQAREFFFQDYNADQYVIDSVVAVE